MSTADPVAALLSDASRVFEQEVHLRSISQGRTWRLRAVRESGEVIPYTAETAAQAFRQATWTYSASDLPLFETGGNYTPRRGDILTAGSEHFKVVEVGGVTTVPRFDNGMTDRVTVFTERTS